MMNFGEVITVFNLLPASGGFCRERPLRRCVVKGAFWYPLYGAVFDRDKTERDSVVVMLPDYPDCLPHVDWLKIDCPDGFFTLAPGDIIVRGEYGEAGSVSEISGAEKIVVSSVRDCRFGSDFMRHWEVYGK